MARTVGMVLIGLGVAICAIGGLLIVSLSVQGRLRPEAAVLGFGVLFLILIGPLVGVGIVSLSRSWVEKVVAGEEEALRKVLDMVQTRGRVNMADLVISLNTDLSNVQNMVYKLVGLGVFSGYVNWNEGVLYSEDASALHGLERCKHCGGNLTLAGKGVIKCPFCGTEYFLAS